MLEINMFRNNPEMIRKDHDKRGLPHDAIEMVIALDQEWINLQHETNQLRAKKKRCSPRYWSGKESR